MRYANILSLSLLFLLLCGCKQAEKQPAAKAGVTKAIRVDAVAKKVRSRAFKYLAAHQNSDGSYGWRTTRSEATAVVVAIFAESERKYRTEDGPFLSRAVDFVLSNQNKDGSFGAKDKALATSLSVRALKAVGNPEYQKAITRAETFLKTNPARPSPGPMESLALEARARMVQGKWPGGKPDLEWVYSTLNALKKKQHLANDTANNYGGFDGRGKGMEKDPVIATAFAAEVADIFKRNWKKVSSN